MFVCSKRIICLHYYYEDSPLVVTRDVKWWHHCRTAHAWWHGL